MRYHLTLNLGLHVLRPIQFCLYGHHLISCCSFNLVLGVTLRTDRPDCRDGNGLFFELWFATLVVGPNSVYMGTHYTDIWRGWVAHGPLTDSKH